MAVPKPGTAYQPLPSAAPPASARALGKRPRPSGTENDFDQPAAAIRRKNSNPTAGSSINDSNLYKKGMYLDFIQDAFASREKGHNDRYNELVSQFRSLLAAGNLPRASGAATTSMPTSPQLRSWLEGLSNVVSRLDKTHTPLVETILSIPWATMEDAFVAAYMRFIAALVSARPEWLRSVLERCVKGFRYRSPFTTGSSATLKSVTRRTLYARLHTLLRLLISLIPTLSPALSPLLATHFPPKRDSGFSQICYIDNLLALTEYCPALAEDVLGMVIERALNIDVEIQGESEDWEDLEESDVAKRQSVSEIVDQPTKEDEDDSSSDEDELGGIGFGDSDSDDDDELGLNDAQAEKEEMRRKKMAGVMSIEAMKKARDNATKLDAILKVVFDHLAAAHSNRPPAESHSTTTLDDDTASPTEELDTESTETTPTPESAPSPAVIARRLMLFRTLLDIFDRTLLRTFKTRHTQFLLFYLCSLDPASSDHFIGVLLGRALFETDAPAVTRVAAAGYVASFISRAKFVDAAMTRKVVRLLCEYLETQMDANANSNSNGRSNSYNSGVSASSTNGAGHHLPVFYAVAQAIFYIFCFRWKDLMDETDEDEIVLETGRRWMMGLETLKRAISSNFNPLKVCAQPVVSQFASIAHKTNFLYCYAIIDSNQRITTTREAFSLSQISSTSTMPGLIRSVTESTLPIRSRITSLLASSTMPNSPSSPVPRQLLVAEEMDSFFPFDPLKLPLSSLYIDAIYSHWVADDETSSETSSSASSDSGHDDESSSEVDTETEEDFGSRGGLAVPGMRSGGKEDDLDADVARSFEAMSLSLSPSHATFGGRAGGRASGITI